MNHLPCWLSPKDKAIALALIEKADFIYIGPIDDFGTYDDEQGTGYKLATILGWRLGSAYGEVAIEAVRDGAVFGKGLEALPNIDFKQEVKLAKRVIKLAAKAWASSHAKEFTQLTLPLAGVCQNSHQPSSFRRESLPQKSKRSPTDVSDRCYLS